ncbi:coiled-coil domain-containing protein 39 [Austrofundulus limnaeus]|uniref:Coiled-coil domain-containing protein 39 n=1 Tax=Austrofundulus limnaeus TaxID=52670 RepID=A0A2I4AM38_AUSLI|nr:PREDICTED: coiled-coil domain-containing protein 39-like [Austrofundulus limnaeus]
MEIVKFSNKLGRLQGDLDPEERRLLDLKIAELENEQEEKKQVEMTLTNALKECEGRIRHLKKEMEKSEAQQNVLNDGMKNLELLCESSEKELKRVILKKQDIMVEQKITMMGVKRARDLLYSKADDVLSLEMRKLELQKAMNEREDEITVYLTILSQQLRNTEQEKQQLSAELNEKLIRIDKVKSYFQVIILQTAHPEGEEEKSQAYYITKAAQEKEELKQEGDDLDTKVCKMELETEALENTILLFSSGLNSVHSFPSNDNESMSEYQKELQLKEQLTDSENMMRDEEQQTEDLQQNLMDLNLKLESLLQEEQVEKDEICHKQELSAKLNKDIDLLQEKFSRTSTQCSKLTKEIHSVKKTKAETVEEQDIKLKELKEFNKNINKMLNEGMEDSCELGSVLEESLLQASLPLPSPACAVSSQRSSRRNFSQSSSSRRSPASSAGPSPKGPALSSPQPKILNLDFDLTGKPPGL